MTFVELAAHVLIVAIPGLTILAYDKAIEH